MYSLTICFGPAATSWALLFKEESKAGEVYNAYVKYNMGGIEGSVLIGSDDFGQVFAIPFDEIRGMMLEDLELTGQARIERGVMEGRTKAKFDQRFNADPALRAARASQGPSIISPMGRG